MEITVDILGEDTHEIDCDTLGVAEPTYADLLAAVDYNPHEVSVMVDGTPVPEDQSIETDYIRVIRLIKGG